MAGGTEPAEPQLGASPGFRGRGCPRTRGAEEEAGLAVVYWFKANYLLQDAAFHTQTGTIS